MEENDNLLTIESTISIKELIKLILENEKFFDEFIGEFVKAAAEKNLNRKIQRTLNEV